MTLLMGTDDGVYRTDGLPFERDAARPVLDCGAVHGLRAFDGAEGAFAAADEGLFRTTDAGETWDALPLPAGAGAVWSVLATDGALFAGTNDPSLYRSLDGGASWHELRGFRRLPSRGVWESPVDPHRARVRALESPPDSRKRLVAGIESGGFHVSDDGGETWTDRRDDGPDDLHQVLALSREVYVAAAGHLDLDLQHLEGHAFGLGGLYRTTDAGRSWTRLDPGNDYSYTRSLFVQGEVLFVGAATHPPGDWMREGADAALFESEGLGRSLEPVDYPGAPHEVVEAFAALDGRVLCGTAAYPPSGDADGGRVLRRTGEGEYETVGRAPANVAELLVR